MAGAIGSIRLGVAINGWPGNRFESRVETIENRVTRLEELPARIEDLTLQVSRLRTEMHAEFSAVRGER
jgi:hypothetical protein